MSPADVMLCVLLSTLWHWLCSHYPTSDIAQCFHCSASTVLQCYNVFQGYVNWMKWKHFMLTRRIIIHMMRIIALWLRDSTVSTKPLLNRMNACGSNVMTLLWPLFTANTLHICCMLSSSYVALLLACGNILMAICWFYITYSYLRWR